MLVIDIETGPGPWEEISKFMPPFDPADVKGIVTGEFDPASVKTGNLKDQAKIDAKIDEARKAHEAAVANSSRLLAEAEEAHKTAFLDRAALEPTTGRVLAIGYGRADGRKSIVDHVSEVDQRGEDALLAYFWDFYVTSRNANRSIVGHCILTFDLPFLIRRSWALSVDVPDTVKPGRYYDPLFKDTLDVWLCGKRWGSESADLDTLDKFFGGEGKNGNGADFAKLFATDRNAALEYLRNDLEMTARVATAMGVM